MMVRFKSVHNKVISGFQVLHQAKAQVAESDPRQKDRFKFQEWVRYPLCHRRPYRVMKIVRFLGSNLPGLAVKARGGRNMCLTACN
ncbi:hypothetical protein PoB_000273800 [Plakobranchus ocellatus]|uniref:Uncharacterized protein n=1 Tax=Plakobranchus ocellatus TaxID=259542 RepID=A0AAV3Y0R5_9GAST|nr:hypothetical protein PoB_000273800 [Plakobranchus ocellatus]